MPEPYETFETWYLRTHPSVVSSLTLVSGDAHLAADATDEAFARALERWPRLQAMASPSGWLYRVALNELRRRATRNRREREVHGSIADRACPPDWSVEIWDAIEALPVRERTAVVLRYVADLTTDEIAEAMRIRPGTVGSTLHAARARLGASLGEDDPRPTPDLDAKLPEGDRRG